MRPEAEAEMTPGRGDPLGMGPPSHHGSSLLRLGFPDAEAGHASVRSVGDSHTVVLDLGGTQPEGHCYPAKSQGPHGTPSTTTYKIRGERDRPWGHTKSTMEAEFPLFQHCS